VDDKKPSPARGSAPRPAEVQKELPPDSLVEELFRRLQGNTGHPPPSRERVAAALRAVQDLALETGPDEAWPPPLREVSAATCSSCGYQNRPGSHFCGKCGLTLEDTADVPLPAIASPANAPVPGSHVYHHHYHHHYFSDPSGGAPGLVPAPSPDSTLRDTARLRVAAAGQPLSRAETAARALTKEWALACNTKQLDDLVHMYGSDALILRPNHPPVRGTAAIREFYFAVLDAGVGEVELETLRVEVVGDLAYEAGRYKMLVPVTVGKRREERGKYLMVLARHANNEWKIACDCLTSDLSLTTSVETEVAKPPGSRRTP